METRLMAIVRCLMAVLLCFHVGSMVADDDDLFSPAPAPALATGSISGMDFIVRSCSRATLYPALCSATLSRYADSVGKDQGLLAQAAISVSLSKAKRVITYVSQQAGLAASDTPEAAALHDCASTFEDAMDQIRRSLKQMKQMQVVGAGGRSVRFWASNVQTWMSAALTNQDTCTDGFDGVDEGMVKMEVGRRVGLAKKVTSNALALISRYVDDVLSP